jgi:hypothetical protein
MTFSIKLTSEAFVRRRLVSGPIWLELDGLSFPAHEWDDFPVVILGFWLTNIQPFLLGQSSVCECPFMDGPYQFNVQAYRKDCVSVTLVERGGEEEKALVTAKVNSVLLVEQMLSAGEIVVHACKRNHWIDDDLLNLEKLIVDARR